MAERREQIGAGNQKEVFVDPKDSSRVNIEFRNKISPAAIRSAFFLNKIAKLVFPHNFPDIYHAGGTDKSVIKAQRLPHDPDHAEQQKIAIHLFNKYPTKSGVTTEDAQKAEELFSRTEDRTVDPRVQEFYQKAKDKGLFLDSKGQNYSISEDGVVNYLDLNPAWIIGQEDLLTFDETKLLKAIDGLPSTDKKNALAYFNRLKILIAEEQKGRTI